MHLIIDKSDEPAGCRVIDVGFGCLAVLFDKFSLTAAFVDEAEVKNAGNHEFDGPESARSGSQHLIKTVNNFGRSELVSRKVSLFPGIHTSFHVADVGEAHVL